MSGKGAAEAYLHGLDSGGRPKFGPRDGAHEYSSIDKATNRQSALKADGDGLAEVEPAGTLRLKGNPSQKEIDRLAYGARTGRWRK